MLRTIKRWFSDTETRALADDVQRAQDQVLTMAHRLEGLQLRIERMTNRVNMRLTRAGLPREDESRDEELMRQMVNNGPMRNGEIFDEAPPPDWR